MIVQIKVRDDNGKYREAFAGEFAIAAFDKLVSFSGWGWMRDRLASWCLRRAERESSNNVAADAWIARYQAIRGIR